MGHQHPCLIELFTEELPPKALLKLRDSFRTSMQTELEQSGFSFDNITAFATPRRLAILIDNLNETQPDQVIERKGPALSAAYDADGNATPACLGFAKSCGVNVSDLETVKSEKGEWLYCKVNKKGGTIQEHLPTLILNAFKQLPVPKFMRWGSHDTQFARPVHNLIVLYGTEVIEMEAYSCKSNNNLHGHRFMSPPPFSLKHPKQYEETLKKKGYVIADFDLRQTMIKDSINEAVSKKFNNDANAVIKQDLLDEVTALVEWPIALIVPFDPAFLSVPQEALISAMEQHQKCFAIRDSNNALVPFFITISNIESKDPKQVILGNERVMHARLSDAAFFYNTDCTISLSSYSERLQHITYEKTLGTLLDKVNRIKALCNLMAPKEHVNTSFKAATLCKSDLVTLMVEEFPELQGIMGKYYAQNDDEPEAVSNAIAEHYLPRHAGDNLPHSPEGMTLAIADRLDTLVGIFGIGNIPTGDKDPFALRRAALGILRIIIERKLDYDLGALIDQAISGYTPSTLTQKNLKSQLLQFFSDRLRSLSKDYTISTDVFLAVNATGINQPHDALEKMNAVEFFKTTPESKSLASANKRVGNILKKQNITENLTLDESLLSDVAEKELNNALNEIQENFSHSIRLSNYKDALSLLAKLDKPINQFFDKVMVMADDEAIRNNRIALLQQARSLFLTIADVALLQ